jgi:hypothetical protein
MLFFYLLGGFLFFCGGVAVILHYADDAEECLMAALALIVSTIFWPVAIIPAGIVGLGKMMGKF